MSFVITDWNLNPNQTWYVKISDAGSDMLVELYPTEADAIAETNLVASGSADFGTGSEIILAMDEAGTPDISLFNSALNYHLKVTGADSDTTKTFQVLPFIDLLEVNNSIYRSEALIQKRATHEINTHTHTAKHRDVGVANHIPGIVTGDVLQIQSTRRTMDVLTTVQELTIVGTVDSLTNQIETVEYVDMEQG